MKIKTVLRMKTRTNLKDRKITYILKEIKEKETRKNTVKKLLYILGEIQHFNRPTNEGLSLK